MLNFDVKLCIMIIIKIIKIIIIIIITTIEIITKLFITERNTKFSERTQCNGTKEN